MKKYLIITFTLFCLQYIFSQDSTAYRYLPLSIGNVWVYQFQYHSTYNGNSSGYQIVKVTSAVNHDSKTYYVINIETRFIQGTYICGIRTFFENGAQLRVDTISGNVFGWEYCEHDSKEYMIDSLKANYYDSSNTCYYPGNRIYCFDTASQNIFQTTKQSKSFTVSGGIEAFTSWKYVKDFGISSAGYGNPFYYCSSELKGCVINNLMFGDTTTIIGIQTISSEIPQSFLLEQNYPNPFNPSTNIKFSIPLLRGVSAESGGGVFTSIKVYDILGREVETLVNQSLTPGTYQVDWNAANYPSGLYFYTLTAGDYTETKKLILLK